MKKYLLRPELLAIAVIMIVALWTAPAHAGSSYVYIQAGQGELGTTTPAAVSVKTDAGNGQPYTVLDFTTGTADTAFFHFVVPADFDSTNSSGTVLLTTQIFPETDAAVYSDNHNACFKASIVAFVAGSGANYRSNAIPAPYGTMTPVASFGQYISTVSAVSVLSFYNATAGATCASTACRGAEAVVKLQRIACGSGTDITGAVALTDFLLTYMN